jgi:hypothetical protein
MKMLVPPSTPKEMASLITDFLNKYNAPTSEMLAHMTSEHRTLQQLFTSLCLEWIAICAHEDYRHDLRNEGSHEVCKKLIAAYKEQTGMDFHPRLPFI